VTENGLGHTLVDFLASSSGHPAFPRQPQLPKYLTQ
jgi:hypothetical protein